MTGPSVQSQVLLDVVSGLQLDVVLEVLGLQAHLLQIGVEGHAGSLQLLEQLLQQVGLSSLGHGGGNLDIHALDELVQTSALLQARQHGLLLSSQALSQARAQLLDILEAQGLLDPLIGDLGEDLLADGFDLDVEVGSSRSCP